MENVCEVDNIDAIVQSPAQDGLIASFNHL
jgi:hypothetical protein